MAIKTATGAQDILNKFVEQLKGLQQGPARERAMEQQQQAPTKVTIEHGKDGVNLQFSQKGLDPNAFSSGMIPAIFQQSMADASAIMPYKPPTFGEAYKLGMGNFQLTNPHIRGSGLVNVSNFIGSIARAKAGLRQQRKGEQKNLAQQIAQERLAMQQSEAHAAARASSRQVKQETPGGMKFYGTNAAANIERLGKGLLLADGNIDMANLKATLKDLVENQPDMVKAAGGPRTIGSLLLAGAQKSQKEWKAAQKKEKRGISGGARRGAGEISHQEVSLQVKRYYDLIPENYDDMGAAEKIDTLKGLIEAAGTTSGPQAQTALTQGFRPIMNTAFKEVMKQYEGMSQAWVTMQMSPEAVSQEAKGKGMTGTEYTSQMTLALAQKRREVREAALTMSYADPSIDAMWKRYLGKKDSKDLREHKIGEMLRETANPQDRRFTSRQLGMYLKNPLLYMSRRTTTPQTGKPKRKKGKKGKVLSSYSIGAL